MDNLIGMNEDHDHYDNVGDEEDTFLSKKNTNKRGNSDTNTEISQCDDRNVIYNKLENLESRFKTVNSIYEDISSITNDQSKN